MSERTIRLLAELACGQHPDAAAILAQPRDELLTLAGEFGIISLLADCLADVRHPDAKRAVATSLLTTARRERLLSLLHKLIEAGARGTPIVIKGGGLLLGGHLTNRDMVDLDVVVPTSQRESWRDAAARIGAEWQGDRVDQDDKIISPDGVIDLHTALPGFAGRDPGPSYDDLAARSTASTLPDILVPEPHAAREIAVQHFLFHHDGELTHALRILQDLAALENEPDGEGLPWGREGVVEATANMRLIVRQIRDGKQDDSPANDYLAALATCQGIHAGLTFAERAEQWIEDKPGLSGKAQIIAKRLFPPLDQLRATPDESTARAALRYLTRPMQLLWKFVTTRQRVNPAVAAWRQEIERVKGTGPT